MKKVCEISGETDEEERINYLTHLIGFILSLFGFGYLIWRAWSSTEGIQLASFIVYATTLTAMFAASTFYHGSYKLHRKKTLKIVDHICIYLLIAGTYTPLTAIPLQNEGGLLLFSVVWGVALMGIALKIFAPNRFHVLSVTAYLMLGWLVLLIMPTLFRELSHESLTWLIVGGISYTVGVIFYAWNKIPFNHGIWHLFVLGGSISHYFCILGILN